MSASNESKACTACYWHRIVTCEPGKAELHACTNLVIIDLSIEDVIELEDGGDRVINCDIARRMGPSCGPRGAQYISGIRIWLCLRAHSRPASSSSISVAMSAP